jgi:hypothetical protein
MYSQWQRSGNGVFGNIVQAYTLGRNEETAVNTSRADL